MGITSGDSDLVKSPAPEDDAWDLGNLDTPLTGGGEKDKARDILASTSKKKFPGLS